ncbi:MAG: riboflavin biosynthesis protein RibD [Micavibrio sp.]|nr:riboflavin biosynthesis protein RibD [Micavibrio sp.]|tara:strand:+ start:401 stop:1396 length:996 start_codon:yes stop_codon:yes gene_type:complete
MHNSDEYYMRVALAHGQRGLGNTAPNPAVGCVIVKDDRILGVGHTSPGGRPHAEVNALKQAAFEAKDADAYVTLEPCSHTGQTPPCCDALIKAGIKRVIIGCTDPDPRVSGQGIERLKAAGISVVTNCLEAECLKSNKGFFLKINEKRPYVCLKVASSQDHMIAAKEGARTQISGKMAARYTHNLRSYYDAIMVGSETFLIDNPQLTTRLEGYEHNIKRYILDGSGRIQDAMQGFNIITDKVVDTRNISAVLSYLAEQGITRLLVEGGARLHESFLESGMVDEFQHIQSHNVIGNEGVCASYLNKPTSFGLDKFKSRSLGDDRLDIYKRAS